MDRRSFINDVALFTGGLAVAGGSLARRSEAFGAGSPTHANRAAGYGPLVPTATKNTGETYLELPKGFDYNVIGKVRTPMSDGRPTPAAHDGMWAFKVGRELRLVRNHEVSGGKIPRPGMAIGVANHYDDAAPGGTTTLIVDAKMRTIVRDFVSLSGTLINCAGGPTPWGSWITCEETTLGKTVRTSASGVKSGGYAKPHGYCFEVPASANTSVLAVPLKAMGRFVHEAVAVDPRPGIVYLTEDHGSAGFYRFIPKRAKRLAEGGTLQMLAIKDSPRYDTRRGQKQGTVLDAVWVTIDRPDPPEADVDEIAVYKQGLAKGGATFARLEGCHADARGNIHFVSTSGGDIRGGQIWHYRATGRDAGRLTLVFESTRRDVLDMPDNICMRPGTSDLFICEDSDYVGEGGTPENLVRVLSPDGRMSDFARNITPNFTKSEFAGSTFSLDGKTLFLNLQTVGATFAIWGNWEKSRG